MQRRDNFAHFILAGVIVLGIVLLMVDVEAQAQIAFTSNRDGRAHVKPTTDIFVMDADGGESAKPH